MMTSFILKKKKELEPSTTTRHLLDSRHFELIKFIQFYLKLVWIEIAVEETPICV